MRLSGALLLLAAIPALTAPPAPESFFGHTMGADRKLLDWDRMVAYFRALERESDKLAVREIGRSTGGRPMIAVFLAEPSTLGNLERYREIQKRLADPRRTPPQEAEKLFAEGKAVVMITCSIHSTEVASNSTAVEFAWRLVTQDTPKHRAILSNTIFILVPSLNPDGVDLVTQWYRKTLGTPYEGTSPPELYQKYVGHDNNRDWYIFSQAETRNVVSQLHNRWHPQIVYDVHQQGPNASRMFVPPWMDPIDPNIDPILVQLCNAVGAGMAADLTAAGKTGVAINAMYDFWTPARHYQAYHGGLRILSESASARLASPVTIEAGSISTSALGYNPRERTWNHLEPWPGGEWRQRDIVDYQLIAWESCLYQAAMRREDLLRAFYRIGQRALERPSPYAFVLPPEQRDPSAARHLLDTLRFGLVEVDRALTGFTAAGRSYPSGSYVIRLRQPYGSFAKTLLERQRYPDLRLYPGGPPKRPYDVTAHTLPLLMGVEVDTITETFTASLAPAGDIVFAQAGPVPQGALAASDSDSWRAVNRTWRQGKSVWRDAAGHFYLSPTAQARRLQPPRIGLYKSYVASMDEGWTRWMLENFGFAYRSLFDKDVRAGGLRRHFDSILIADMRASSIHSGHPEGAMPSEYVGGLGEAGAAALREFVQQGGTLVLLNRSTEYARHHLGVAARNGLDGVSSRDFYAPGSLLHASLDSSHPLAQGLPANLTLWSEGSPAWDATEGQRSVVRYWQSGVLASGWLLGEKHLAGRTALLEVPCGKGRVVLFGMRPQYRAQSYLTLKLLWNALLYY